MLALTTCRVFTVMYKLNIIDSDKLDSKAIENRKRYGKESINGSKRSVLVIRNPTFLDNIFDTEEIITVITVITVIQNYSNK